MPVSDTVTKITASILVNITGVDALSLVLLETKTPEFSLIYTDSYLFMKEDREAFMSQVKIERKILDDLKIRLAFKLGSLKLKVRIADMQYLKTPVEYGDTLLLSFYAFLREDQLGKLFKPSYVIVPVQDVIVSKKEDILSQEDKNTIWYFYANREKLINIKEQRYLVEKHT